MSFSSDVGLFAATAEHAHLAAVVERLEADALALAGRAVHQHHVGCVDRRFALDDAAGLVGLGIRLGVALDQVDVLHDDAIFRDAQHLALLALVFAGDHDDLITFADTVHGNDPKNILVYL